MSCTGKDGEGCSRSCTRFEPTKKDGGSKCRQCKHRKKHHKKPTVTEILDKYKAQVTAVPVRASEAAARMETYAGFRQKDGGKKGDPSNRKASKETETSKFKATRVGSVSIITSGLDSKGELREPRCPSSSEFEALFSCDLAVVQTEKGEEIRFKKNWDQARIDKWMRVLMPDVFMFLDQRYPEEAYHWVLLNKDRLKLYVMKRPITGELLEEVKGSKSKPAAEHAIRIATKHKIPSAVYKIGFKKAVERMKLEGNPASESENESPKRKHKRTGQQPYEV
ncbi:hypothetical protein C8R45DRAFT_1105076 [Mycena sanguinolenta]|nr:hypothetical protein C8R45DRAFT_1105076 [Mycena sanguinolenta]